MAQIQTKFIADQAVTAAKIASGTITNTQISASAAIVYSKLSLTNSIVNADIASAAAIAYSKLALTASIVNADIATAAAIAYSKLALSNSIVNADINSAAAIAYSKLALSNSIVNADISSSAAIVYSKLVLTASILASDINSGAATSGQVLTANGSGGATYVSPATALTAIEQTITLIAGDITNQYIDLAHPISGASVSINSLTLDIAGGPRQVKTVDYSVSLTGGSGGVTRVTFLGDLATGGAAALVTGDKMIFAYEY